MKKGEFLKLFAKRAKISYDEAELFYEKFIQRFTKALKSGQGVRISGFGEFEVKTRKGKKIIDRNTGVERLIPSKAVVAFSPAKIFTEKVNIKYKNLKPVVIKASPPTVEVKESNEFNLTFFESKPRLAKVELEFEKSQVYKQVVEEIEISKSQDEDYLLLPSDVTTEQKIYNNDREFSFEIPVFHVFDRTKEEPEVIEVKQPKILGESQIKQEGDKMPEFNLTEEPKQPEKKKLYDDTLKKEEDKTMTFEYEEGGGKGVGFWVFILVVFLVFVGGVIFLLNQYGYIHLWGERKKVSRVEFKQPEEVVVTVPPEARPEIKTPSTVEEKKVEPTITTPKLEKPAPRVGKSYVVQVASFQDKKLAEAYARNLKKKGYNAFVERAFVEWKGGDWYRVRIGYFDSMEQANKIANRLKKEEKLERIWVSEAVRSITK
jgi:integration host factor subunit alpha